MQIQYFKVGDLQPYKNNPRKNDKAVDAVANSIKEFGFKVPIIIDKNNEIIAGHTRLKAAKKLGLKEVPCIIADDLTKEQVKAFRLADNKVSELAEWDFDLLNIELADIKLDMEYFGFDLTTEEKEVIEDDFEIELPEEPKAKLGDIYKLGNHRLMCGDSTNPQDVEKLMGGVIADIVVTDPPYNVNISNSQGMTIENDNMDTEEFEKFLFKAFTNLETSLKKGGAFYVWYASRSHIEFEQALKKSGLTVRQQLIWNKSSFVFGRQDYHWKHEPCLYGWKDGEAHYFVDDRTQSTIIEDKGIDLKKLKKEEMLKLLQDIYSDKISTTVINESKVATSDLHPTMKPIRMIAGLIKNSSRIEEIVLDLFGGSGSTLIACEQLKRKAYLMEFDPHYVDVIIKRYEDFTGKKAEKIN